MQCNYIGRMDSKMELFADNNNGFGDAGKIKGSRGCTSICRVWKGSQESGLYKIGLLFLIQSNSWAFLFLFFKLGKQEKFLQISNRSLIIKGRIFGQFFSCFPTTALLMSYQCVSTHLSTRCLLMRFYCFKIINIISFVMMLKFLLTMLCRRR